MNTDRLRGLMGLSVRAGQAVFGEDGCLKTLRAGQCGVLLLDRGISPAAADRYRGICERQGIPLAVLPEDLLEDATGRPGRAMAVKAGSLAESIKGCLQAIQ